MSPLDRTTYLTSLDDFKLSAPPKSFRSSISAAAHQKIQNSPAITDFEDPRSPRVVQGGAHKQQNLLRFAAFTSNQTATRHSQSLANSLTSYPRSPCPSAPLGPTEEAYNAVVVGTDDAPTHRARASSLELPKRNKKGLTLGPSVAPTPSSLGRSIFSPFIDEGAKKPVPLDLESRLSEAFWEAVSLEEDCDDDEAMVTALEYPSSAATVDDPQIMYASADGALWSPALPKAGAAVNKIRESLMSAGGASKRSSFGGSGNIVRKDFTAPTPNDPFAAFPSFAAAMGSGAIAYLSRVVLG